MQCMLGPAREYTAIHRPPLFSLLCLFEEWLSLRVASLDIWRHHRQSRIVNGSGMIIGCWWSYRPPMDCRSALKTAGRQRMSAEPAIDSSRGQGIAWQCNSSKVCTNPIPHHVYDSKGHGPWFSDHQSRISMRDGPKNQVCIFMSNEMQCIQSNQGASTSIMTWSRGRACMPMQCNPNHVS